jgi:CubicO group peptidase (beta-lactamase class C family)
MRKAKQSYRNLLFLPLLVLLYACAEPLSVANPPLPQAEQPLSWSARAGINGLLNASVWMGQRSGYIALFAKDGELVHATTAGYADVESLSPMTLDTRVRMASMTKPVTAVAAMILMEEGRLGLDDPVSDYIPVAASLQVASQQQPDASGEFVLQALQQPLSVRHLLTFSSGIGSQEGEGELVELWAANSIYRTGGSLGDRVDRILSLPLFEQPGTRWRYGWSADVLARVVEVASGQSFDAFLQQRIFDPLGMVHTSFLPPADQRQGMASVYTQNEEGKLQPVSYFKNDAPDWTPGGSGLVSTAGDYMRFALMLLNGGVYEDARILQSDTVAEMTHPHVKSGVLAERDIEGLGWGLGVAVAVDSEATPFGDYNGDFWWSGYYGTTFFVSPSANMVGVVLSQNEPAANSDDPIALYAVQGLALMQ